MKKSLGWLGLLLIFFVACQNAQTPVSQAPSAQTSLEDSLYKSVLALHDAAMPKMGKIMGLKKMAKEKMDSLAALPDREKQTGIQIQIDRYQGLFNQLTAAEKGMNDWMEAFNPDPAGEDQAAKIRYFESEKLKAQKMKDDIFIALDSAAAILK